MNNQIDVGSFNVAGVAHRPANIIDSLESDQPIRFVAEPANPYDKFAIKVEASIVKERPEVSEIAESWELIGYVPRKETHRYHLLRKLGVKLTLKLFVNHDATDADKLLVKVTAAGDENNSF